MNNTVNGCISFCCFAICIWFAVQYCLHKNMATGSESWKRVSGTMQTMTMQKVATRRSYYYKPYVVYHYSLGGKIYRSSAIAFPDPTYSTKKEADFFASCYPEGGLISVYYDPSAVDRSCLKRGVSEPLERELWYAGVALFMSLVFAFTPGRWSACSDTGSRIMPSR